mgnify:CR=1 FL=1
MIEILRLSHRIRRDKRLSSHVALASRAFGANKVYYSGQHDSSLENSINKIVKRWGNHFSIEYIKSPLNLIKQKKKNSFFIIHLTCYGLELKKEIQKIRKKKKILVVVGSEKVPPEIYKISDLNLSISNQPHSEVSALAIFLHEYFQGKELTKQFKNAKLKVIPKGKGKLVKHNI